MSFFLNVFIFFLFSGNVLHASLDKNQAKFILITSLYKETNADRAQEYLFCLDRNIRHNFIKKIHVIYDTLNDVYKVHEQNKILDYLKSHPSIEITYYRGRPTFDFLFDIANKQYPQEKIILSNADIYFDETLSLLGDYDLTNKFLSLSRWDVLPNNILRPCFKDDAINDINRYGADSWIFSTPLLSFNDIDFGMGTWGCDGRIIYQAYKSKLRVLNPCKDIRCCHMHKSAIRNYKRQEPEKNMAWVRAGNIKDSDAEVIILKEYKDENHGKLRVVCTAALLDQKFDMRKDEYIKSFKILADYGVKNLYIVEALKGAGPSFLNDYSSNVYYSRAQDFSVQDIRDKGINEARTLLDGLNYFNFDPNDVILKLTGRYYLKSNQLLELIEQNPDVDVFVKILHDETWAITGCFAMRYRYLKDFLQNLDYTEMAKKHIYIERKFMQYIKSMVENKIGKVMFIKKLDVSALVAGTNRYEQRQW